MTIQYRQLMLDPNLALDLLLHLLIYMHAETLYQFSYTVTHYLIGQAANIK